MKRLVMVVGMAGWLLVGGWCMPTAYAAWTDWPGVSQVYKVGGCLLQDAGKVTTSLAIHTAAFVTDAVVIVRDCLNYTVSVLTPGTDAPVPPHETPSLEPIHE